MHLALDAVASLLQPFHNIALRSLQAGTYNVNGRPPPPGLDLRPWLDAGAGADIVAVALQECVPLSASNVVMGAARTLTPVRKDSHVLHVSVSRAHERSSSYKITAPCAAELAVQTLPSTAPGSGARDACM